MRARRRGGFTLLEVIIALVMLSVIILGLASTTVAFMHEISTDNVRVRAGSVADARIAMARTWPEYFTLDDFAMIRADFPEPGWSEQTLVARTQTSTNDFTRVTVRVSAPSLSAPVQRTVTLAAP
jgi:prepilin-type N-terminal cleavage/methylation domain-containing protein